MKHRLIFSLAALVICSLPMAAGAAAAAPTLATRMQGRILLQVESHGEAWYVRSKDLKRYYLKDGAAAYSIMRFFSQGITDADLAKIPQVSDTSEMKASSSACANNALANRLRGGILLQVQQHGEAWYVDPVKCRAIYMKDGAVAYEVMRFLGLGILTSDLKMIEDGGTVAGSDSSATTPPVSEQPDVPVASNPETVYCDWSGKSSIVAPGMNNHAYKYCKLDFSKVASGTNMKLNIQNGGGASKASVDLFPPGAVILSSGRQTDSICYIYDLSSNASDYAICNIAQPGIYTLGMEGNWFSTPYSTNEITYEISKLAN